MSNFTPAPWVRQGQGIVLHPVTQRQMLTERIETPLGIIELLDGTNEPQPNADLIAAAPELYKVMASILAYHVRFHENGEEFGDLDECALLSLMEETKRVIAKAEGKA